MTQGDGTETGIARYVRFTYDAAGNKLALEAWAKAPGNGNHYGWDKGWKEGKSGQGVDPQGQGEGRAAQGKSGDSSSGGKPSKDPVLEMSLNLRYVMNPLARSPEALTVTDGLDQTTTYLYGLGRLAAYDSAGAAAYFLTDHAGSVRQMATPGGSVLDRYSYSPYGVPLGGDLDPGARLATGNLFGFTGAEHDPAFALVDLGARTYSPDLARFLTPDPLAAGAGMALPGNPYSYAACDPLGYVDPTGLIEERLGLDQYPTPGELLFWNVVETVGAASAAMLVILAAPVAGTAVGIAALAVGGALIASHLTAVVEDWEAYLQGDYGSVGGNDPVYAWAAEHLGSWGTVALGIAEGVFWARFPGMTGLRSLGGELGDPVQSGPATGQRASIGWTGMIGEEDLARLGGEAHKQFWTPYGYRYADRFADGVIHEAKVGYQYLSARMGAQIAKDEWLLSNARVRGVAWHFYRSPVTYVIGPSGPLRLALQKAGFQIILEGGTP